MRAKTFLSVIGPIRIRRPYYFCSHCCKGQSPVDSALDIAGRESSPDVRRMEAVVGSNAPFGRGCEPLKALAGLEVTAKAIERTAESIGADIASREQQEMDRAKQLVFPLVCKQNIPKMYVLMDGSHPGMQVGCVFTQTRVDDEGRPMRDPESTTYTGAIETAEEFGLRLYTEAWRRGWEWATLRIVIGMAPSGSGTSPICTFREPSKSSISITPGSTCGLSPRCCFQTNHEIAGSSPLSVYLTKAALRA